MPRWNNQFRTAELNPAINTYKEGYHHGDHLGLSNVDTDLIPWNIIEYINIFGVEGIAVWGGLSLPKASILSFYENLIIIIGKNKEIIASSMDVTLSKETADTFTPSISTIKDNTIITIAQSKELISSSMIEIMDYHCLAPVGGAVADDGGSETDQTTQANEDTANDMTLLPATPVVGDAYMFGCASTFAAIHLKQETTGVGTWDTVWKYWNGAWVDLSGVVDDETNDFRPNLGVYPANRFRASWTIPGDWALKTIQGKNLYWVRAEVTSYIGITTQPKGTRTWIELSTG